MKKYADAPVMAGEDEPFFPVGASAFTTYDCEVISTLSNKLGANVTPVTSPSLPSSDRDTVIKIDPDEGSELSKGQPDKGDLNE